MAGDYLQPYREMIRRVGPRFESLLWTSRESQRARFQAITEIIDLHGVNMLDMGCGHADLLGYLRERGVHPSRYIGVEALPEMLRVAMERTWPSERTAVEFVEADFVREPERLREITPAPEVVVFSGSLNTFRQEAAMRCLDWAWELATKALVFNFLPVHRPEDVEAEELSGGPARRFDTMAMIYFALERTPLVRFRQDYLEGMDATIVMGVQ